MVDRLPDAEGATWTSSNPDIVEVLPGERFLARGAGAADLIASREGQEARVTLSVTSPYDRTGEPRLTGLEVLGLPVLHDEIVALEDAVKVYGIYNHQTLQEVPAALSSADPDVLTVDDDGTIHVMGVGATTVTASYEGHATSRRFGVTTREKSRAALVDNLGEGFDCGLVAHLAPSWAARHMMQGMTVPFVLTEMCVDGTIRRTRDVRLASTNPEVIEVGPGGFLTAKHPGQATVEPLQAGIGILDQPTGQSGFGVFTVLPEFEFTPEALSQRSYQDRPDDYEGPQIHVVYAVPEDVADRGLDLSGQLEASFASVQNWIWQAIGYQLNLDTYGGRPDITFVRMLTPHGSVEDSFQDLLDGLDRAMGLQRDKKYLVFAPVWSYLLGKASVQEGVGAVYLDRHMSMAWGAHLDNFFPVESEFDITGGERTALHELLHTFGAVAGCAPNFDGSSHVDDAPDDVMWAGSGFRIDVGRDDYFGHGRDDCLDTADSPFWRQVATLTTHASATRRINSPEDKRAIANMEAQILSLFGPDPYLRCALPH